jgi:tRNA (uracil-5-)-methyltransferase
MYTGMLMICIPCGQVNFHTALSGEALVTLLYHKKLGDDWCEAARAIRAELQAAAPSAHGNVPHIIGRSRKQKVCLEQDYVVERLTVHGKQYVYRQYEV